MLHMNIGKDSRAGADAVAIADGVECVAFNQALVREHRAGVDINADEITAAGSAEGERSLGVIAQDIEPEGNFTAARMAQPAAVIAAIVSGPTALLVKARHRNSQRRWRARHHVRRRGHRLQRNQSAP